jgi:hypothetical protein
MKMVKYDDVYSLFYMEVLKPSWNKVLEFV